MCKSSLNLWVSHIHPCSKGKRKKLDSTSIKWIFVGYNLSLKAYRIYMKEGRQIEVSTHVIFHENHAYKKSKDIPIESDDEDVPLFEEDVHHDKTTTN